MRAVQDYAKSPAGKKKTQDKIKEYRSNGVSQTCAGSMIWTEKLMREAADHLMEILKRRAYECELPESVMRHFDSLRMTDLVYDVAKGRYSTTVYFADERTGDTFRPSLKGNGEGVDNIIALFDTGYLASRYVYGYWSSHEVWTRSKLSRVGLRFIEDAITEFNSIYGRYNVTAEAG